VDVHVARAFGVGQLREQTTKCVNIARILSPRFTIRGIVMPAVDEDNQKDWSARVYDLASGLSELAAVPKITFVVELNERKVIRAT
jgi:hypothetical protein